MGLDIVRILAKHPVYWSVSIVLSPDQVSVEQAEMLKQLVFPSTRISGPLTDLWSPDRVQTLIDTPDVSPAAIIVPRNGIGFPNAEVSAHGRAVLRLTDGAAARLGLTGRALAGGGRELLIDLTGPAWRCQCARIASLTPPPLLTLDCPYNLTAPDGPEAAHWTIRPRATFAEMPSGAVNLADLAANLTGDNATTLRPAVHCTGGADDDFDGKAQGRVTFEWRGPVTWQTVCGVAQAVAQAGLGRALLVARYAPADPCPLPPLPPTHGAVVAAWASNEWNVPKKTDY